MKCHDLSMHNSILIASFPLPCTISHNCRTAQTFQSCVTNFIHNDSCPFLKWCKVQTLHRITDLINAKDNVICSYPNGMQIGGMI